MGDVHGAHRALVQVLERCGFERGTDRLIFLGDVADGWPQTRECIDELLGIPGLVALRGNHDEWFEEWLLSGSGPPQPAWYHQGGRSTIESYGGARENVPAAHLAYLAGLKLWHQEGNRVFVHGGWPWYMHPHPMSYSLVMWDRELWTSAVERATLAETAGEEPVPLTTFDEVYVGHTTTTRAGFTEPVQRCEVWNLDQGAGWEGRLSIMDIDSKEFWQSDVVAELYPDHAGRRRSL